MSDVPGDRSSGTRDGDGDRRSGDPGSGDGEAAEPGSRSAAEGDGVEALRERVEEEYDFEDFGPADMAQMSAEEWEAAFDAETWITGPELLDRVENDVRSRIAARDVFAALERVETEAGDRLLAYSDEGYAVVYPDGTVEGQGTVLRDLKPSVALSSMEDYAPNTPPADATLPDPDDVESGTGEFGNLMLQLIAGAQALVGLGLLGAWVVTDLSTIVAPAAALIFLLAGVFLFTVVANARLADKFRAEEYRERLRAVGGPDGERPAFVPADEELLTPGEEGELVAGDAGAGVAGEGAPDGASASDDDSAVGSGS